MSHHRDYVKGKRITIYGPPDGEILKTPRATRRRNRAPPRPRPPAHEREPGWPSRHPARSPASPETTCAARVRGAPRCDERTRLWEHLAWGGSARQRRRSRHRPRREDRALRLGGTSERALADPRRPRRRRPFGQPPAPGQRGGRTRGDRAVSCRRDADRLGDILEAIVAIRSHLTRGDRSDGLVFDAVRVRLIEIGEA